MRCAIPFESSGTSRRLYELSTRYYGVYEYYMLYEVGIVKASRQASNKNKTRPVSVNKNKCPT